MCRLRQQNPHLVRSHRSMVVIQRVVLKTQGPQVSFDKYCISALIAAGNRETRPCCAMHLRAGSLRHSSSWPPCIRVCLHCHLGTRPTVYYTPLRVGDGQRQCWCAAAGCSRAIGTPTAGMVAALAVAVARLVPDAVAGPLRVLRRPWDTFEPALSMALVAPDSSTTESARFSPL